MWFILAKDEAKAQYNVKNVVFIHSFFTFLGRKPQFFPLKQKFMNFQVLHFPDNMHFKFTPNKRSRQIKGAFNN